MHFVDATSHHNQHAQTGEFARQVKQQITVETSTQCKSFRNKMTGREREASCQQADKLVVTCPAIAFDCHLSCGPGTCPNVHSMQNASVPVQNVCAPVQNACAPVQIACALVQIASVPVQNA